MHYTDILKLAEAIGRIVQFNEVMESYAMKYYKSIKSRRKVYNLQPAIVIGIPNRLNPRASFNHLQHARSH